MIHDARERLVAVCEPLHEEQALQRRGDFRVTRDHVLSEHACFAAEPNGSVIESAIRPSGSLECSDASLYTYTWSWRVPVADVYSASSGLNKRSVCKVRGRPIQASTECRKSRRFQTKGIGTRFWPSGSLPGARYSLVGLFLQPWKRAGESEILIRTGEFVLFWTKRVTHVFLLLEDVVSTNGKAKENELGSRVALEK